MRRGGYRPRKVGFTAWPACAPHADRARVPGSLRGLKPRPAVPAGRRVRNPILERNKKTARMLPADNEKEYVT
jgi:hypothetical protein